MNLIEFFGLKVKPKQTKGKGLWAPCENVKIDDNIYAIRDTDVNLFLIKSDTGYIAIDSGYKNSSNVTKGLEELNINPYEVKAVFLTHVDLDHAGGVDSRCKNIFQNAQIYISREEEKYLTKKLFRKKILGVGLSSPIKLNNYNLLDDNQNVVIDGINITSIFTPGHTMGHMSYIFNDKTLFTGDMLIIGDDGGYCFMDFWNINSEINMQSLDKIYEIIKEKDINLVITSHSGISKDIEFIFRNRKEMPNWKKKGFVFRKDAASNPY